MANFDHYRVNVSLNGRHFFATEANSTRDKESTQALLAVFRDKFPEAEGYQIRVTRWETRGHEVDL